MHQIFISGPVYHCVNKFSYHCVNSSGVENKTMMSFAIGILKFDKCKFLYLFTNFSAETGNPFSQLGSQHGSSRTSTSSSGLPCSLSSSRNTCPENEHCAEEEATFNYRCTCDAGYIRHPSTNLCIGRNSLFILRILFRSTSNMG